MNTIHKQFLVSEQLRLNPPPAHITKKADEIIKWKFEYMNKLKNKK